MGIKWENKFGEKVYSWESEEPKRRTTIEGLFVSLLRKLEVVVQRRMPESFLSYSWGWGFSFGLLLLSHYFGIAKL